MVDNDSKGKAAENGGSGSVLPDCGEGPERLPRGPGSRSPDRAKNDFEAAITNALGDLRNAKRYVEGRACGGHQPGAHHHGGSGQAVGGPEGRQKDL